MIYDKRYNDDGWSVSASGERGFHGIVFSTTEKGYESIIIPYIK